MICLNLIFYPRRVLKRGSVSELDVDEKSICTWKYKRHKSQVAFWKVNVSLRAIIAGIGVSISVVSGAVVVLYRLESQR